MFMRRLLVGGALALGAVAATTTVPSGKVWSQITGTTYCDEAPTLLSKGLSKFPSREETVEQLQEDKEWDILVIGGGATGCGIALDAALRGLDVALVEKNDFASGTSSRSTKLIHGGVRYLEKAFTNLDYAQYQLVREALRERSNLLKIAPHMAYELPIMLPIYHWWKLPYYWAGCKVYDMLAGKQGLESSYLLPKSRALEKFPWLKREDLVGALVYYDGAHNDARMNVSLALTSLAYGATLVNHVEVVSLVKRPDQSGKEIVCGAQVRDTLTGKEWSIRTKGVISAVGPFTDEMLLMDNENASKIVSPSQGVHVILPGYYSPENMGLLDPATSDGRIIFFLPWEGSTIAGTTDAPTEVTHRPKATEEEVRFILKEIKHYLSPDIQVRRGDVLAAWSGIRPLVRDPSKPSTEGLSRNHVVHVTESNMVVIAGGKWTTYRQMAEDAVDKAIEAFNLQPASECRTLDAVLVGGHRYRPTMFIDIIQHSGIETDIAKHLVASYGDRAADVAKLAAFTGKRWPVSGVRLNQAYPYIEAEVRYAVREEMARTVEDVIARRLRLAFLNSDAAMECLPRVVDIMADELNWSPKQKEKQVAECKEFLKTMGYAGTVRSEFNANELVQFRDAFDEMDVNGDGTISLAELKHGLSRLGIAVEESEVSSFYNKADEDRSGGIEWNEFLEILHDIRSAKDKTKYGELGSRLAERVDPAPQPDRSGGGV